MAQDVPPPPPPPQNQPGYPTGGYPPAYGTPSSNGLAIAGMVLGIASIPLFFLNWIDAIIGIVGLVLSLVGLSKAKQLGGVGRGMAIAGVVTSSIGIVASIVFLVAAVNYIQDNPSGF